jgi:hypothetical protein
MSIDVIAFNPTDENFHYRNYPAGVWDDLIEVSTTVAGEIAEHAPYDPNSQMNGEVEPEETDRVGQLLLQAIEAASPNDDWRLRSPDLRDWAEFLVACRGYRWF